MTTLTVTPLSKEDAATLVTDIRSSFESAWDHYAAGCSQLVEAYQGRAWEPLGLAGWAEFVTHTLDVAHLRIPKAERLEFVRILSEGGMSLRDVGATIGVTKSTVQRDLEYVSQMGREKAVLDAFGSRDATFDFCVEAGAGPCAVHSAAARAIAEGDTSRENIECRIREAVEAEARMVEAITVTVQDPPALAPTSEPVVPAPSKPCYQAVGRIQGLTATLEQLEWSSLPPQDIAAARKSMATFLTTLNRVRRHLEELEQRAEPAA
jgi:hypothetical protein